MSDLEKATKQAYAMVTYFGMSEKVGNISFYDSTGQAEYSFNKPYSETTAELIDNEAKAIIEKGYQRAKDILIKNKEKHIELAELLLEQEVIFAEDLERIFGPRKNQPEELKAFTSDSLGLKKGEAKKSESKKKKASKVESDKTDPDTTKQEDSLNGEETIKE